MMRDSNSRTIKKLYRDAAWSTFMTRLEYKAECAGISVFRVDPRNTSNLCSRCGNMVRKDPSVRIHECPHCNLKMDRDINAARNILSHGLGQQGLVQHETDRISEQSKMTASTPCSRVSTLGLGEPVKSFY